jgi:hypothetical protein
MKANAGKHNKDEGNLIGVAESIGSAMGLIVGRASAAQRAVTQSPVARILKSRKLSPRERAKKAGRKLKMSTRPGLKKRKVARVAQRG